MGDSVLHGSSVVCIHSEKAQKYIIVGEKVSCSQAWWRTPLILGLWEFQDSLVYIVSLVM